MVIDPLGLAAIFALTRGTPEKERRETAIRGVALAAGILFLFALVGDGLLSALGIGIPAFRIASGALLFLLSLDIIFRSNRTAGVRSSAKQEAKDDSHREDISVLPLAIPLNVVVFMGMLLAVLLLTLLSLLLAPRVRSLFGETGANVFSRVLGVLLAVQFVLDGIRMGFNLS